MFKHLFFLMLHSGWRLLRVPSEVWGIYDKDDFTNCEKDIIEKTHIFLCKQSLGVNKQCPNVAARNELGRLPLKLTIDSNISKFWIHLQNLLDDNFAKQCLHLSKDMAEKNQPGISQIKIKTLCGEYSSRSHLQCRSKSVQSFNHPSTLNSGNLFLQYFQKRSQQNRISRWNKKSSP